MPPRAFDQAVVERQRHDIEAEIGRALHVGVAAEDVGAGAGRADIAGGEQQDAARAHVGRADRVLGRAHAQIRVDGFSVANILATRSSCAPGTPVTRSTSSGVPLLDLLADVVHAVDALFDELLVFPAVLEDVPEHSVDDRNVGAGTQPHIFRGMRGGAGQARIDDDEVRAIESPCLRADAGATPDAPRPDCRRGRTWSWNCGCRCSCWSSRRSPRYWLRRRRWWNGRCAPGDRSCWCPRTRQACG